MKILMLCDNYPPEMNANARIFSELAELWAGNEQDITVITSHPNFPKGKIFPGFKNTWLTRTNVNQVKVMRIKTYMYPNQGLVRRTLDFISFGIAAFIAGIFQARKQHEIIVAVSPQFFCALSGLCLALWHKKPFIFIVCDLWPDSVVANNIIKHGVGYRLIKKIEHWMYRKSDSIIALSNGIRDHIINMGISATKIMVSVSGATADFHPRKKNPAILARYNLTDKFVVGYIGTFGASHSLEDLIMIAQSFQQDGNSDIIFFMIGDGIKRHKLKMHQEHHLHNLIVDGPVCKEDIPDYWSVVDVSIIPLALTTTNKTVLPSKILEGMAMGIPPILYGPYGSAAEFLAQLDCGWHITAGDTCALQQLLEHLLHNRHELADQQAHLAEHARTFSRENQAAQLLENFSSILSRHAKCNNIHQ